MLISFFEEFPTNENLAKLKLISWRTKLYLAAKSYNEFSKLESKIKKQYKNVAEVIYWPILEKKEGYWISPFTKRKALKRIFHELGGERIAVMLDLELPTTQNPLLYISQAINFFRNKRLIRNFVNNYGSQVYLCEYYPQGKLQELILQALGLHYKNKNAKIIKLVYHSLHNFDQEFIEKELKRGKEEFGKKFIVSYGTIATGIHGTEKILTNEQLTLDLKLARKYKINEVILFRLAGLTPKFLPLLKTH